MLVKAMRAWNRYKYRLVPWISKNINEHSPRVIVPHMSNEETLSKKEITKILSSLCKDFTVGDTIKPYVSAKTDYLMNMQVCEDKLGFTVETQPSNLEDGGTGVFVSTGRVTKGSLVALYPGTVYQPWEPVFFISVANAYLFRCADGIHIDGSSDKLSKSIYLSCAKRDRHFGEYTCDIQWLDRQPLNPLAIGQYVNNQTKELPANVAYQEYWLPNDWPFEWKRFIPNVEARSNTDVTLESHNVDRQLKMVVLVALRDIEQGEELYSSYYTLVYGEEGDGELEGEGRGELEGEAKPEKVVPAEEEQKKILEKKRQFTGKKKMRT